MCVCVKMIRYARRGHPCPRRAATGPPHILPKSQGRATCGSYVSGAQAWSCRGARSGHCASGDCLCNTDERPVPGVLVMMERLFRRKSIRRIHHPGDRNVKINPLSRVKGGDYHGRSTRFIVTCRLCGTGCAKRPWRGFTSRFLRHQRLGSYGHLRHRVVSVRVLLPKRPCTDRRRTFVARKSSCQRQKRRLRRFEPFGFLKDVARQKPCSCFLEAALGARPMPVV